MQEDPLHVVDAKALHNRRRKHARGKRAAEDLLELLVQATNAQLLEIELLVLEQLRRYNAALPLNRNASPCNIKAFFRFLEAMG